jgi:hypothetical protein
VDNDGDGFVDETYGSPVSGALLGQTDVDFGVGGLTYTANAGLQELCLTGPSS